MSGPASKGISPWADAWRRLRKNRMAMIGLVVVVLMGLSAVFAPALVDFDPTYGFNWVGAQEPGYEHPDVLNRNLLVRGEAPEVCERYLDATHLRFEVRPVRDRRIRLQSRRGETRMLMWLEGAERVERIETGPDQTLHVSFADGSLGPGLTGVVLEKGAEIPAALQEEADANRGVLILVLREPLSEKVAYEATVHEGEVEVLLENDVPVARAEFEGRHVVSAFADGVEQRARHRLGTDRSGRDLFSRVLYGGRISLLVGLVATIVSLVIGVVYGAVSGYAGGKVDGVLMAIVDILYGIPYMFLVILLLVNFGRDITILFIALGAVQWLTMARIVRGQVLSLKQKEFVEAARMSGTGPAGILFGHLVPNTLGVVAVYTTLTVPAVILQESFLAFIGLAVEYNGQPLASWGALVKSGVDALGDDGARSWLLVWPSLAMAVTLFSLNFLGDGLRDALDPQQRGRT